MKVLVLNGPNINFIGIREQEIYGKLTYKNIIKQIKTYALAKDVKIKIKQTNHEGRLIDLIQKCYLHKYDCLIINPGAYSHYSIAILDALKSIVPIRVVEVHLTDIYKRQSYRQKSITGEACEKIFFGKGINSYLEAIDYLLK